MTKVVQHIPKTIRRENIEMPGSALDPSLPGGHRARFGARLRTITILSQGQLDRSRVSSI